jgi:hypothetical protein
MLRQRLVPLLAAIPLDWRVWFVLLCTAMALLEEVIATTMPRLTPLLGTTPEEAHITASISYHEVVCFHSVVVFVPMFMASASINPTSLIDGFWVFVYGLMVYLPARTVPGERRAEPPRWRLYTLAVILPIVAAIPVVPVVVCLRK